MLRVPLQQPPEISRKGLGRGVRWCVRTIPYLSDRHVDAMLRRHWASWHVFLIIAFLSFSVRFGGTCQICDAGCGSVASLGRRARDLYGVEICLEKEMMAQPDNEKLTVPRGFHHTFYFEDLSDN